LIVKKGTSYHLIIISSFSETSLSLLKIFLTIADQSFVMLTEKSSIEIMTIQVYKQRRQKIMESRLRIFFGIGIIFTLLFLNRCGTVDDADIDQQTLPPANPYVGVNGAANMHGDTASSDTSPFPGPGTGGIRYVSKVLTATCPTIVLRYDGNPYALCTSYFGLAPVVYLLDKHTGEPMAKLRLSAGNLLGGVYAYVDNHDRLVMVHGNNDLVWVKAEYVHNKWELSIDNSVSLSDAVTKHCGSPTCDAVSAINVGYDGLIWFVSAKSVAGYYDPFSGEIASILLAENEGVFNSFSTAPGGRTAIVTDYALYLLTKGDGGLPKVEWRYEYDRGPFRNPGQLSHGSGATPTFFGPVTGTEYVTITDNAVPLMSLLVLDAGPETPGEGGRGGELICQKQLFSTGSSGTENSAIAVGRSIFVASTYGYPYPKVPEGAGPAVPPTADFIGGMVRVDLRMDEQACDLVWETDVRSSAVPKLSTADGFVYTVERIDANGNYATSFLDSYDFTVMDSETGAVLYHEQIGSGFFHNTLEMVGNTGDDRVLWVGTLSGVTRIEPVR